MALYDDERVASCYLELPADSFRGMPGDLGLWRPKFLAVPDFKGQYVRYLDTLARFVADPGVIYPRIDAIENQIAPAACEDPCCALDYGYAFADFQNGFDDSIQGHAPLGIKPILDLRNDSIRS